MMKLMRVALFLQTPAQHIRPLSICSVPSLYTFQGYVHFSHTTVHGCHRWVWSFLAVSKQEINGIPM